MQIELIDVVIKLGGAVAVGVVIGLNRDMHNKPMGMRTLGLVALGAASVSVASVHYADLSAHPDALSRVVQGLIQGIMGGIGFLGAGVILRDTKHRRIEGLTTAATAWVTAALGIACGLGDWTVVGTAIVLAVLLLVGVAWLDHLALGRDEDRPPP